MKEYQSLSHTKWDCKCRKKRIFGALRRHLGRIFHELAGHKESKVVEGLTSGTKSKRRSATIN